MKTYGLRDIIGPIMVGPSSSHTAGALALASMARKLFGEQPERAVFTLYGSFAATGSGHGTDKALVAGILGLATDDPRVADAFALAKAAGVSVEIIWDTTTEVAHPNTVDIRCESREGRTLEMRGVSIGGGAAVIRRINGIDVDIAMSAGCSPTSPACWPAAASTLPTRTCTARPSAATPTPSLRPIAPWMRACASF